MSYRGGFSMKSIFNRLLFAGVAVAFATDAVAAQNQTLRTAEQFPTKPIRFIAPSSAGDSSISLDVPLALRERG